MNKIEISKINKFDIYYVMTVGEDKVVTLSSVVHKEHYRAIKKEVFDDIERRKFLNQLGLVKQRRYEKLRKEHLGD